MKRKISGLLISLFLVSMLFSCNNTQRNETNSQQSINTVSDNSESESYVSFDSPLSNDETIIEESSKGIYEETSSIETEVSIVGKWYGEKNYFSDELKYNTASFFHAEECSNLNCRGFISLQLVWEFTSDGVFKRYYDLEDYDEKRIEYLIAFIEAEREYAKQTNREQEYENYLAQNSFEDLLETVSISSFILDYDSYECNYTYENNMITADDEKVYCNYIKHNANEEYLILVAFDDKDTNPEDHINVIALSKQKD